MFESSWQFKVLFSLIIWVIIRFSIESSLLKQKQQIQNQIHKQQISELNSKKDK